MPASDDASPEAGFRLELGREIEGLPQLATITLNRPERLNSQTPVMWEALLGAASSLPGSVRVVVIRAEGRSFSAGLDRGMFSTDPVPGAPGTLALAQESRQNASAMIGRWQRAFDWRSSASIVSIAAVQGHAVGAGFQLALGCDLRVVADDAQFTMAEPTLGLVPDLGGTKRLVDLVGYSRAADICLTGRRVGAAEALQLGLASRVVPAGELDNEVTAVLDALLAVDRGAATETKALLAAAPARSQGEQEEAERLAQHRRMRSLLGLDDES